MYELHILCPEDCHYYTHGAGNGQLWNDIFSACCLFYRRSKTMFMNLNHSYRSTYCIECVLDHCSWQHYRQGLQLRLPLHALMFLLHAFMDHYRHWNSWTFIWSFQHMLSDDFHLWFHIICSVTGTDFNWLFLQYVFFMLKRLSILKGHWCAFKSALSF